MLIYHQVNKIDNIINGMLHATLPSRYWEHVDIDFLELEKSKTIIQKNNESVYEHTMTVIDILTTKNPVTLLAGLFHDLGKGFVTISNDPSLPKFSGHASKSKEIAIAKLLQWGANKNLVDSVARLIGTHMYSISRITKERSIRKFIADVGFRNINDWFVLRMADSMSYNKNRQHYAYYIRQFETFIISYLKKYPSGDLQASFNLNDINSAQIEGG